MNGGTHGEYTGIETNLREVEGMEATPEEYIQRVIDLDGKILGMNDIGVVTAVTAYLGIGAFETIVWVAPRDHWDAEKQQPHPLSVARLGHWPTLETAYGFHCALARKLWTLNYGKSQAARAGWFKTSIMPEVVYELHQLFMGAKK